MPLIRIDMRRGKSTAYKHAIREGIYRAMLEEFAVPKDDRFMIVNEHDANNFVHAESYPGLRNEDVFINLVEVKKENWPFGNGIAQYL